jgi:hypothetical protein
MKFILFIIVLATFLFAFSKEAFATESTLRCTPTTGTYQVGSTFTVDYVLDTRNFPIFGADIIATYDTSILETVGTQSTPITTSTNWGQPATNTIDTVLGKIDLDYGNSQPSFTGSGSVGQVTFRAKAAGQAQFNYTFFQQYDDTTPGVAKVWGKRDGVNLSNILTDVNNCIYLIEGSAPTPTSPPGMPTATLPPGAPTYTPAPPPPTVIQLPRAGNMETSIFFLGLASLFITIGGTTIAVLKKDK